MSTAAAAAASQGAGEPRSTWKQRHATRSLFRRSTLVGRRALMTAGALALSACFMTTSDAFVFAPTTAVRRASNTPPSDGRGGVMRDGRWTWGGGGGGVGGVLGSAMPVVQRRRKRWRGGNTAGFGVGIVSMSSSLEAGLGDVFKVPDERILKAVEKAGNRAVPSDVATLAGVDLNVAKTGLVNLANLVGGDLEVSKDGDIVYNFPSNFRAALLQKSAYRRAVETVRGAWPVVFFGIRVSFGVVLLASIFLIFSTIFFAATYASSSSNEGRDDRRRGGGGGGFGGGPMGFNTYFGPSPFDFFYYRPYYGYYNTPIRQRGNPEEMGLLESIFSYIFGDGNPNANIEERRVEAAATLIRGNGGAVSAEQLAPLLTPGNPRPDGSLVDEAFVLPILTALDGAPEVTSDGDIVYVFPSLQTSAMTGGGVADRKEAERLQGLQSLSTADLRVSLEAVGIRAQTIFERSELVDAAMKAGIAKLADGRIVLEDRSSSRGKASGRVGGRAGSVGRGGIIPEPLEEEERPFSVAAQWKKAAAGVLGVVNLGGALYLRGLLSGPAFVGVTLPGYYGFVQGAMPFLLTYAIAFNAIPAVRWVLNKRANAQIQERNFLRRQWSSVARSGGAMVDRKLKAARSMTTDLKVIKAEDVEYTTARSLTEQNINAEDSLLDDFDARLKNAQKPPPPQQQQQQKSSGGAEEEGDQPADIK